MTKLIHTLDDVPGWAKAVACARCERVRIIDRRHARLGLALDPVRHEVLYCEGCATEGEGRAKGWGGFIPLRGVPAGHGAGELPSELERGWTRVPHALWDHRGAMRLDPAEVLVALAIWRHQSGSHRAYPAVPTLARETGLSEST